MAQCKWCGRSGESLLVTEDELCEACEPGVMMDIANRLRMINHCKKLVEESNELDAQLSNCDIIVEHAEALLEYDKCGIPTIQPSPAELVRAYREGRDGLILKSAEREVENALAAADIVTSTDAKATQLSKVLLKIRDYKTKANSPGVLDAVEKNVTNLVHQIQLTAYLEEARDAMVKGQRKRALDLYNDAVHFLERDEIDKSLRQEHAPAIEAKIAELGEAEEAEPEEGETE